MFVETRIDTDREVEVYTRVVEEYDFSEWSEEAEECGEEWIELSEGRWELNLGECIVIVVDVRV